MVDFLDCDSVGQQTNELAAALEKLIAAPAALSDADPFASRRDVPAVALKTEPVAFGVGGHVAWIADSDVQQVDLLVEKQNAVALLIVVASLTAVSVAPQVDALKIIVAVAMKPAVPQAASIVAPLLVEDLAMQIEAAVAFELLIDKEVVG